MRSLNRQLSLLTPLVFYKLPGLFARGLRFPALLWQRTRLSPEPALAARSFRRYSPLPWEPPLLLPRLLLSLLVFLLSFLWR